MKESAQTANAFVRGANLDTSMMYMGSIMSFLVRAQDTDGRFAMVSIAHGRAMSRLRTCIYWNTRYSPFLKARSSALRGPGRDGQSRRNDLSSEREGTCILYPNRISPNADHLPGNHRRDGRLGQLLREHPPSAATSMDIPTDAVTYLTDDPSYPRSEAGEKYGIKMLSPKEARRALPHFGRLGANLT